MTLAPPLQGNRARYDITVVSPDNDPSGKESKRFSRKGYSRVKNIGTKMGAAFIALMIAGLMLLGNISTAPAATAGGWGMLDGLKDVICGTAYFNSEPDDRGLGANTADPKLGMDPTKVKLTGYEKYGMAGMTWTVWIGPVKHGEIEGDGSVAGKQLVAMGGGKDSLNKWANIKDGTENTYSTFYNTKEQCAPIGDVGPTAVGNFLLSVTSWIVHISNLLFQTATETSSSVLLTLSPTVVAIVGKLKDALYLEFLAPVLMIGALFLAWKGLVKRSSTEAGTAALWMLGATVAGFAILANPMFLPSVVNTVVSKVSETTIASITQIAQSNSSTAGSSASGSNLCSTGDFNGKTQTSDSSGKMTIKDFDPSQNAARTSVRQIQCTMWYSFMYTPWVIGQFGVSPSADSTVLTSGYPNKTGDTDPLKNSKGEGVPQNIPLGAGNTPGNWAIYQLDNKVNYPGSNKNDQQVGMLNVAASQIYKAENANGTWKGTSSTNRVTTATLALISSLGAGAMIGIISMSMIVLQIGLVILTLFAPLFLLVGVHPGFGRRIAMGWLESMAGLAMKRIVLSVLLSVMLVFYSAVLSASASIDWLISMIMVIAVSVGGITYKDQLTTMFSRISFGGNGGLSEQDMGGKHLKRAAGGVLSGAAGFAGAATAMSIGAIAGGAGARKNNKELQQKAREEIAARRQGDDPSAGAGERPNGGPNDGSPTDSSSAGGDGAPFIDGSAGAGERPAGNGEIDGQGELFPESDTSRLYGPAENPSAGATGRHAESARDEIDGQGGLFPEVDVRPKQNFEADPRMAGDIAAGQDIVNQERRKLYGQRPATEDDGRRAAIDKAQQDALRENARYNRFHKINAGKGKFTSKIDATKGKVQRTVGMVGDKQRNVASAVNRSAGAVTRSVAKSTPVRAVTATTARAREAANSYHTLAKSNSSTYNKAIERHNENKVVKQVRRDENKVAQQKRQEENKEIKRIVATHEKRASVAGEAMRQAKARAQSRKNSELQRMIKRTTRRM